MVFKFFIKLSSRFVHFPVIRDMHVSRKKFADRDAVKLHAPTRSNNATVPNLYKPY